MKFHNPYLITALTFGKSCFLEDFVRAGLTHFVPNHIHSTTSFKSVHSVSGKGLSHDLNGLVLQCIRVNKIFRGHNATCSTVLKMVGQNRVIHPTYWRTHRRRATHELSEISGDLRRSQDFVDAPSIAELWVRVLQRMFVILRGCLGVRYLDTEGFESRPHQFWPDVQHRRHILKNILGRHCRTNVERQAHSFHLEPPRSL